MDYLFKVLFALFLFIPMWLYQEENQQWDLYRNILKDGSNFAVHDAGQEINAEELGNGRIIFNPTQAEETFYKSLQLNLGLDDLLKPTNKSRLTSEVRVLHFEIIDESKYTFPYLHENTTYNIVKYMQGPSIVAVIEIDHPKFFNHSFNHDPIRVPAIYEYKERQL